MLPVRVLLLLLGLLFDLSSIFAAQINLEAKNNSLSSPDDELTVNVTIYNNVSDNTVNYLRGAFYKSGSTNYCGFTWNGQNWTSYSNSYSNFLPITINDSSWSGQLKSKIDSAAGGCKAGGEYLFKLHRFVTNDYINDTQNPITISVNIPTVVPTMTPTDIPTKTSTPTPLSNLTKIPTAKPQATVATSLNTIPTLETKSTGKKSPTPNTRLTTTAASTKSPQVLSEISEITPTIAIKSSKISKNNRMVVSMSITGVGLAVLSGALAWQKKLSKHETTK